MLIKMKSIWKNFWKDEAGMGVVEVILIIIVLIGLVIIFQEQINDLVESIFETVVDKSGQVN